MVNGLLSQLVEQVTLNHRVRGSNPLQPTKVTRELVSSGRSFQNLPAFSGQRKGNLLAQSVNDFGMI